MQYRVKTLIAKAEASGVHKVFHYGTDTVVIRVYNDESCTGEHTSLTLHGSRAVFYGSKVSLKKAAQFMGLD